MDFIAFHQLPLYCVFACHLDPTVAKQLYCVPCDWVSHLRVPLHFLIGMTNSAAYSLYGRDETLAHLLYHCTLFEARRCALQLVSATWTTDHLIGKYQWKLALSLLPFQGHKISIALLKGGQTLQTLATVSEHSSAGLFTMTVSLLLFSSFHFPICSPSPTIA